MAKTMADRLAVLKKATEDRSKQTLPGTMLDGDVLYVQHVGHCQTQAWHPAVLIVHTDFTGQVLLYANDIPWAAYAPKRLEFSVTTSYRRTHMGQVAGTRAVECIEEMRVLIYDPRKCPDIARLNDELRGR